MSVVDTSGNIKNTFYKIIGYEKQKNNGMNI